MELPFTLAKWDSKMPRRKGSSKRILIVDDEPQLLTLLTDVFQMYGWETKTASNGQEAVMTTKIFKPSVILSDVKMPTMDGLEFLIALTLVGDDTPVIFLSAFRDSKKTQMAWAHGAFDFLDKPFVVENLLQVCDNALETGRDYVRAARLRYQKMKKPA